MYKSADAKKAYFQERYKKNKERYAKANEEHWIKYTKKKLNKEDVTEEEIRLCKNEYYREYRQRNKSKVQKNLDDFWQRKADEHNAI